MSSGKSGSSGSSGSTERERERREEKRREEKRREEKRREEKRREEKRREEKRERERESVSPSQRGDSGIRLYINEKMIKILKFVSGKFSKMHLSDVNWKGMYIAPHPAIQYEYDFICVPCRPALNPNEFGWNE